MISVSLVEDDQDIRQSLAQIIDGLPGQVCLGAYLDGESLLNEIDVLTPDVILMDIELPGISGIECVRKVKTKYPEIDIIMLTVHDDEKMVFESLCAGACGYLTKNTEPGRIVSAIKEAVNGGAPMSTNVARMVVQSFNRSPSSHLTSRETDVLDLLCKGFSYKMIADTLFVSQDTVRSHIKSIYRKLEVHSKSEAVVKALKFRWFIKPNP